MLKKEQDIFLLSAQRVFSDFQVMPFACASAEGKPAKSFIRDASPPS
jgi:hypothetical protein